MEVTNVMIKQPVPTQKEHTTVLVYMDTQARDKTAQVYDSILVIRTFN